jgi:hypothetical protein
MQRAAKLAEKMARVLRIVRIAMRPFRVPGPSLVRGPDFAAEFSLGSQRHRSDLALGLILHRIWVDGTEFRWTREAVPAA